MKSLSPFSSSPHGQRVVAANEVAEAVVLSTDRRLDAIPSLEVRVFDRVPPLDCWEDVRRVVVPDGVVDGVVLVVAILLDPVVL